MSLQALHEDDAAYAPNATMAVDAIFRHDEVDESLRIGGFILAIIMTTCGLFGMLGNIASICVFLHKNMRSSISVLLVGLSSVDFFVIFLALCTFAMQQVSEVARNVVLEIYVVYTSVTTYPLVMAAQTMSVCLLVVITVERYVVVCHPFLARKLCTRRRAFICLCVIAAFGFAYNVVRFWEYKIQEKPGDAPTIEECLRMDQRYFDSYYTIAYLVVNFLAPFLLISILNFRVLHTVRLAHFERRSLTTQQSREHRVALMMILIIITFALCNSCAFSLNIAEAVQRDLFFNETTRTAAFLALDVSNVLVVINSSAGAIIYYCFSQRYRRTFRKIFCLHRIVSRQSSTQIDRVLSVALLPITFQDRRLYAELDAALKKRKGKGKDNSMLHERWFATGKKHANTTKSGSNISPNTTDIFRQRKDTKTTALSASCSKAQNEEECSALLSLEPSVAMELSLNVIEVAPPVDHVSQTTTYLYAPAFKRPAPIETFKNLGFDSFETESNNKKV